MFGRQVDILATLARFANCHVASYLIFDKFTANY